MRVSWTLLPMTSGGSWNPDLLILSLLSTWPYTYAPTWQLCILNSSNCFKILTCLWGTCDQFLCVWILAIFLPGTVSLIYQKPIINDVMTIIMNEKVQIWPFETLMPLYLALNLLFKTKNRVLKCYKNYFHKMTVCYKGKLTSKLNTSCKTLNFL